MFVPTILGARDIFDTSMRKKFPPANVNVTEFLEYKGSLGVFWFTRFFSSIARTDCVRCRNLHTMGIKVHILMGRIGV